MRDGVALLLPMLAELPFVLTALLACAGLAVALAAAGSHLFTLAGSLADDVYGALGWRPLVLPRLMAAWAAIGTCALAVIIFLLIAEVDALQNAVTAFAFAARRSRLPRGVSRRSDCLGIPIVPASSSTARDSPRR